MLTQEECRAVRWSADMPSYSMIGDSAHPAAVGDVKIGVVNMFSTLTFPVKDTNTENNSLDTLTSLMAHKISFSSAKMRFSLSSYLADLLDIPIAPATSCESPP